MHMKIGHHGGPGGNLTGIGDAWRRLDSAGIPAVFGSADHAGSVYELAQIARASGVEHQMFWRSTLTDVPSYTVEPHIAALHHWQNVRARIPPELLPYKDLIWIIPVNEVDHENYADWLGHFSVEISQLMLNDGFKHLAFGWAGGTPEAAHWEEPGILEYLSLCEDNPTNLGVALHEYSYSINDIKRMYPYLLGRFFMLFNACDEHGIARPTTLITEWGWEYQNVPPLHQGLQDILWAASLYAPYPQIKGATGWYLGSGYGNIAQQFVNYIGPMADMAVDFHPIDVELPIDPTPEVPNETLEEFLWRVSVDEQIARGIPLNPDAALQRWFYDRDFNVVHREVTPVYGGEAYTIQAGESLSGAQPRTVSVWQPGVDIWSFQKPSGTPSNPLEGFTIGPIFRLPYVLTAPYGVPRDYDGDGIFDDLHEGSDYDINVLVADSQEPVLCGVPGRVLFAGNSGGAYGWFVIVETVYKGLTIELWYCHMDQVYVSQGDTVDVGTWLGELGDTGGPWAEHVHLNMVVIGLGSLDPRFPIQHTLDPHPYVNMQPAPSPQTFDLAGYLFPAIGNYGDIVILRNNWGQGDERQQLQREGSYSYVTKNQQYEKRLVGADYISLLLDTSPGDGKYYTVQGNWLPRYMKVGDTFRRTEHVKVHRKSDCMMLNSFAWTTDIKFVEKLNIATFDGITVNNVARFAWYLNGQVEEQYWFGLGLGLVQWLKADGKKSWPRQIIPQGTQHDNVREVIPCL